MNGEFGIGLAEDNFSVVDLDRRVAEFLAENVFDFFRQVLEEVEFLALREEQED